MKGMFRISVAILGLVVASFSFADDWSGAREISSIRIYSDENVLITMTDFLNPLGCSRIDYIGLVGADSEAGKRKYSALLAAYASKSKVQLSFSKCSGSGQNGWPIIDNVWLQ